MTVAVSLNKFSTHSLLDTRSAVSIIDLGTTRRIDVENSILRSSAVSLLNASGEMMTILNSVVIEVQLMGYRVCKQQFQVLDSVPFSNNLLGRDFMCNFNTVTFDFTHNNIELGPISVSGLTIKNAPLKLNANTSIPARSEKIIWVSSSRASA